MDPRLRGGDDDGGGGRDHDDRGRGHAHGGVQLAPPHTLHLPLGT